MPHDRKPSRHARVAPILAAACARGRHRPGTRCPMRSWMTLHRHWMLRPTAFALIALIGGPQPGCAEDEFYKGKTVNLIIATAPGGGYDTYGRLIARHLGRHLPGQPTIVVQNMPGAAGIRAANYLYGVAPKDGTVIGMIDQ